MGAKSPRRRAVRRGKLRGGFTQYDHGEPIKAIDTRPMTFVFGLIILVLLVLQKMPFHALTIDLPGVAELEDVPSEPDKLVRIFINEDGGVLINGQAIADKALPSALAALPSSASPREVMFTPSPNTPYSKTVSVLNQVAIAGLTAEKFCFEGIKEHSNFTSQETARSAGYVGALSIASDIALPPKKQFLNSEFADRFSNESPRSFDSCTSRTLLRRPS